MTFGLLIFAVSSNETEAVQLALGSFYPVMLLSGMCSLKSLFYRSFGFKSDRDQCFWGFVLFVLFFSSRCLGVLWPVEAIPHGLNYV